MNIISDLKRQFNMLRILLIIPIVCIIAAVVAIFVRPVISIFLVLLAAAIYFLIFRHCRKNYESAVTRASLEATLCRKLNAASPNPEGNTYITDHTIMDSHLLPVDDSDTKPLLCWELYGTYHEFDVALCDATSVQKYVSSSGRNNIHTSSGVFCSIESKKDLNSDFIIMEKDFLPLNVMTDMFEHLPEYKLASAGNEDLDKKFYLYISDQCRDCSLTALFQQDLKHLSDFTPGHIAVSVIGNNIYSFISERFISRTVSLSEEITEENLKTDPFPELKYLIDMAESF